MKLAAAHAIANLIAPEELSDDSIIPGVFNGKVAKTVAGEVMKAAIRTGVA
jgi:malate dehydrogenase (oxaloacetate-decarboxylating)